MCGCFFSCFYIRSYLDQLAEEINDKLQETGQVTVSELCKAYDLPGDFLIQVMQATNLANVEFIVFTFFCYLCSIHGCNYYKFFLILSRKVLGTQKVQCNSYSQNEVDVSLSTTGQNLFRIFITGRNRPGLVMSGTGQISVRSENLFV